MAKAQAARIVTEVAPPQLVTVVRRKVSRFLETIAEEEHRGDVRAAAELTTGTGLHHPFKAAAIAAARASPSSSSSSSPCMYNKAARTDGADGWPYGAGQFNVNASGTTRQWIQISGNSPEKRAMGR